MNIRAYFIILPTAAKLSNTRRDNEHSITLLPAYIFFNGITDQIVRSYSITSETRSVQPEFHYADFATK